MLENDVLEAENQTSRCIVDDLSTNVRSDRVSCEDRNSGHRHQKTAKQYAVIGFEHMNMMKFTAFSVANSVCLRTILYPTVLIKTRLQCDPGGRTYSNAFDAFKKIIRNEKLRGLYRGYSTYIASSFAGCTYILTFENVRHLCGKFHMTSLQNFVAGASASVVNQVIMAPIDVLTQHLMMIGQKCDKNRPHLIGKVAIPSNSSVMFVAQSIYSQFGFLGVYKGFLTSNATFASSSALWWHFYYTYNSKLSKYVPESTPVLLCNCVCGPLAGISAAYLTNPLDVIRTRMQVRSHSSASETLRELVQTEGFFKGVHKGVGTRMFNSSFSSLVITFMYEITKRLSLRPEFKHNFSW